MSGATLGLTFVAAACGGGTDDAALTLPPMYTTTTTTTLAPTTTLYVPVVYIVQPGDGLRKIANSFGVDLQELMQRNGITDPDTLYAGQELVIPPPTSVVVTDTLPPGPTTVAPVTS